MQQWFEHMWGWFFIDEYFLSQNKFVKPFYSNQDMGKIMNYQILHCPKQTQNTT